jgi:hypothetical protein
MSKRKLREELIDELQQLNGQHPKGRATRDDYRRRGKYPEVVWHVFFRTFRKFRMAAARRKGPRATLPTEIRKCYAPAPIPYPAPTLPRVC